MISSQDIRSAISRARYTEWSVPSEAAKRISERNARSFLKAATVLLESMEKTGEDFSVSVIQEAYYSIFTWAIRMLAAEGKKFPSGTPDTHQSVFYAFLYFFYIDGSGLEKKNNPEWKEISENKISKKAALDFSDILDETTDLACFAVISSKSAAQDFKSEKDARNRFTYDMEFEAKRSKARDSVKKALNFQNIAERYISA